MRPAETAMRTRGFSAACAPAMADPNLGSLRTIAGCLTLTRMSAPVMNGQWSPPIYAVAPFVATLLSIAVLPLFAARWWEPLRRKLLLSVLLALPIAGMLMISDPERLLHALREYASFISLLGALFVISGGILLTGDLRATPAVNAIFLLGGAVLANLIGTTGASMLLIRPLIQTNRERHRTIHIPIFFIFLVSNIGGCLTPLGDPPLFLGFLRGVPFTWTFRLWPEWAFAVCILVTIFHIIDSIQYRRELRIDKLVDRIRVEPLRIAGAWNLMFLLGVIALVLWVAGPWRELGMITLAAASFLLTPRNIHKGNRFTFYPIQEVAILFFGIFITMVPALILLESRGGDLQITRPWHFFWTAGTLSSFLDNAPTYLSISSLALGKLHLPGDIASPLAQLVGHVEGESILRAISLGAVFMGANTYIGNGPNFMVKSICEERGLRMPGFLGYMGWSAGILIPLFLLVTLVFFRG